MCKTRRYANTGLCRLLQRRMEIDKGGDSLRREMFQFD